MLFDCYNLYLKGEIDYGNRTWSRYRGACMYRAGIGIGIATGKATEAIARQPEAAGKINKALLLGCALAEATAIYGLVIGILIILFLQ